jgi:hypothetical protein
VSRTQWATAIAAALTVASAVVGCPSAGRDDGLDVARLPSEERGDYAVFAQRCSKCHSLSRPLESGITEDAFWVAYVARMRRQPGSGISRSDEVPILRFLHYYSAAQLARNDGPRDDGKDAGR